VRPIASVSAASELTRGSRLPGVSALLLAGFTAVGAAQWLRALAEALPRRC